MNTWMIRNNSIKLHYLKKGFLQQTEHGNITDGYYAHGKRVFKDFEIKNLGEYHDLYVQSNT